VNFELYDEMKGFLFNYFCGIQEEQEEEGKWSSSIENALTRNNVVSSHTLNRNHNMGVSLHNTDVDLEEVRAIPGGRYGCA
jgi:hypothetical protein